MAIISNLTVRGQNIKSVQGGNVLQQINYQGENYNFAEQSQASGTTSAILTDSVPEPLIDFTFEGNTEQASTPTVDSPSPLLSLGTQTVNLFDKYTYVAGYYLDTSGNAVYDDNWGCSNFMLVTPETSYVGTYNTIDGTAQRVFYTLDKTVISTESRTNKTFTTPSNCYFVRDSVAVADINIYQLEQGTTATSYKPFGFEFSLLYGDETNPSSCPIYIREPLRKIDNYVDSINYQSELVTRTIKRVVFDGTENWTSAQVGGTYLPSISKASIGAESFARAATTAISTHFTVTSESSYIQSHTSCFYSGTSSIFFNRIGQETTVTAFKEWLSAQYQAGTPVEFIFVYDTPTTESFIMGDIPADYWQDTQETPIGDNELVVKPNITETPATITENVTGNAGVYFFTSTTINGVNETYNRGIFLFVIDLTQASPSLQSFLSFDFSTNSSGGSAQSTPEIAQYPFQTLPVSEDISSIMTFSNSIFNNANGLQTSVHTYVYNATAPMRSSGTEKFDITELYNKNVGQKLIIAIRAKSINANGKQNVAVSTIKVESVPFSSQELPLIRGTSVINTDGNATSTTADYWKQIRP